MTQGKKELNLEQVRHIADLARIAITPEEEGKLLENLNQILEYFALLDSLDTQTIEPMSHSVDLTNAFAKDEPIASLPVEKALDQAPEQEENQVRVPEVIAE